MIDASVRSQMSRSRADVRSLEHAVLADVGDHVTGAAVAVQPVQRLPQVSPVGHPAARGQPVSRGGDLHVQRDRDPLTVLGDRLRAPRRILHGRRAHVHPRATGGQRSGKGIVVADSPGQLHRDVQLADHLGDHVAVVSPSERRVQVDEVQPPRAVALPLQRGRDRVAVLLAGARDALHELDGLAADNVDSGQQGEIHPHTLTAHPTTTIAHLTTTAAYPTTAVAHLTTAAAPRPLRSLT